MAERNFDSDVPVEVGEGHSFILRGLTFHTKPRVPAAHFMNEKQGIANVISWIQNLLVPEDRDVFTKLIEDPDSGVVVDEIADISNWLVEVYSDNRPTNAPDSSGPGAQPTS